MMAAHLGRIGFVCIFGVLACDGLANNPTDTLSAHGKPALAPHASSDDHSTHEAEPPLLGGTALGHGGHAGGNAFPPA